MAKFTRDKEKLQEYLTITNELVESLSLWYQDQNDDHPTITSTEFSSLAVIALAVYAATVGVDINMTKSDFLAICEQDFDEAYRKAPKFG